jgi:hypothetical protein
MGLLGKTFGRNQIEYAMSEYPQSTSAAAAETAPKPLSAPCTPAVTPVTAPPFGGDTGEG